MCLEVFHPELPIIIPYESEIIEFDGGQTATDTFSFLVRNTAHIPIRSLNVVFSRGLYERTHAGEWRIAGVRDITHTLPTSIGELQGPNDGTLTLKLDDRHPSQHEQATLEGSWLPGDSTFSVTGPTRAHLCLLQKLNYTFFQVELGTLLHPQEGRWFCWQVDLRDIGVTVPSKLGVLVLHQIASPLDVRRTLSEQVQAASRLSQMFGPPWLEEVTQTLREVLGIATERCVDVQYHELVVRPGDSKKCVLLAWTSERDLQMRSPSPRLGSDPQREPVGELLYEWKSGSLLDRPQNGKGFILHFTLLCTD